MHASRPDAAVSWLPAAWCSPLSWTAARTVGYSRASAQRLRPLPQRPTAWTRPRRTYGRDHLAKSAHSNTFIIPTGTATSIVAYENGPRSITPSYKQLTSCTQPGGLLSRLREHVGSVLRNDPFVRRWNTPSSQASRRFRNRRRGAASQAGGVGTRRALGPRASDPPRETTKPGSTPVPECMQVACTSAYTHLHCHTW